MATPIAGLPGVPVVIAAGDVRQVAAIICGRACGSCASAVVVFLRT